MEQDFLRKQKNKKLKKNLIILCLALVAIAAIGFSIAGKLKAQDKKPEDAKVTIEIRCDELSSNMDMLTDKALVDYVPKDGIIVKKTSFKIKSDETTVMDVLQKACKENGKPPNYMASEVKLKDGDEILWFYTVDYDKENYDTK